MAKMGLIENLRAKYDLYRLEQRYTNRSKRSTFISGAQYVDGEYIYASNNDNNNLGNSSESPISSPTQSTSGSGHSWGSLPSRSGGTTPNERKRAGVVRSVSDYFRSSRG